MTPLSCTQLHSPSNSGPQRKAAPGQAQIDRGEPAKATSRQRQRDVTRWRGPRPLQSFGRPDVRGPRVDSGGRCGVRADGE